MNLAFIQGLVAGALLSGTTLLYATLGEVVGQRSGIVNLGIEGLMLVGAAAGFAVAAETGSAVAGIVAAAIAGGLFNLLFGVLVITRRANQLASGLAFMFFGFGLSALIGTSYVGSRIDGLNKVEFPVLTELPFFGPALFRHDPLVYLVFPLAILVWWVLVRTRWGLSVRAVGEDPQVAFAAGKSPSKLRYQALFIGGLLGGIAGAHLSLAVALTWSEFMTGGRGFIAIALVIFAGWKPIQAVAGALLFGGALVLQLQMQAAGVQISPFLLEMTPFVVTLVVLIAWGRSRGRSAPASLGRIYQGTE